MRLHEGGLAVLAAELAVGVEALGADDLAVLEVRGRFLEAIGAHGAQTRVGDELAALLMLVVAVHEGVFLGLPVEALELVGVLGIAQLAQHALHVVGDARGDEAVRHRFAGRVHVALGETHAPLAVHGGEVHLAGCRRRQPDVARLADLGRHDVDVDGKQAAFLDGVHDRSHQGWLVAGRHGVHGVLHDVGALLVGLLELVGVERGLVVIARPDVMHAALALDQQLVDVGGGFADMGVGWTRVAFLVAAHAHAAATGPADVAGGQRDVHERGIGAIVVVAPDETLLVAEHGAATLAVLGFGDPGGGLDDVLGFEAGDLPPHPRAMVLLAATTLSKSLVEADMNALSCQPFSAM